MEEELSYPFAPERVHKQARGNLNALIAGAIAYARAQGHDGKHFATALGTTFANTWGERMTLPEVVAACALNVESVGMKILFVTTDASRGEVIAAGVPEDEAADPALFGLSQDEVDQFWLVFEPIARSKGLSYTFRREGDQLHFIFTR